MEYNMRAAFGTLQPKWNQSDVVEKRRKQQECNRPSPCVPTIPAKKELIIGQFVTMNLTDVNVMSGTSVDGLPLYQTNIIDPDGSLFGNSKCGQWNYMHFVRYK